MVNASCFSLDEISRLAEQIAARFLLLLVASFHDLTNHCWNGILRNHDQERQKKKTDAMRKIESVSCTQTFSFVYTVCQSYPLNHRVKNIYIKKAAYCLIDAVIRDILPNFESSNSGFSFPRENFKSSNRIPPLKRKSSFAWRICCSFPPPVKLTEQQPKHRSEKKNYNNPDTYKRQRWRTLHIQVASQVHRTLRFRFVQSLFWFDISQSVVNNIFSVSLIIRFWQDAWLSGRIVRVRSIRPSLWLVSRHEKDGLLEEMLYNQRSRVDD